MQVAIRQRQGIGQHPRRCGVGSAERTHDHDGSSLSISMDRMMDGMGWMMMGGMGVIGLLLLVLLVLGIAALVKYLLSGRK